MGNVPCFRYDLTLAKLFIDTWGCIIGYTQKPAFLAEPNPRVVSEGQTIEVYFSILNILYTGKVEPRAGNYCS